MQAWTCATSSPSVMAIGMQSVHRVSGSWLVHQLIVPDQNVTINLSIDSWRVAGVEPITFEVSIPPETSTGDENFIQFNNGLWTSPLPLWPLGWWKLSLYLILPVESDTPRSATVFAETNPATKP